MAGEIFDLVTRGPDCPNIDRFSIIILKSPEKNLLRDGIIALFFDYENFPLEYKTYLTNCGFVRKVIDNKMICYYVPQKTKNITKYYKINLVDPIQRALIESILNHVYMAISVLIDTDPRGNPISGIFDIIPDSVIDDNLWNRPQTYESHSDIPVVTKDNAFSSDHPPLKFFELTTETTIVVNGYVRFNIDDEIIDLCKKINLYIIPVIWNMHKGDYSIKKNNKVKK